MMINRDMPKAVVVAVSIFFSWDFQLKMMPQNVLTENK